MDLLLQVLVERPPVEEPGEGIVQRLAGALKEQLPRVAQKRELRGRQQGADHHQRHLARSQQLEIAAGQGARHSAAHPQAKPVRPSR